MTTTLESPASKADFAVARKAMIDSQLRTSGVNEDFVLARMGAVAREDHVPASARGTAYMDRAIRLPDGGHLPSPVFHGMMLAEARPGPDDTVTIVDGGSGYLAALVEPLVKSVTVLTADEAAGSSRKGSNATLLLVDGALEHIPAALAKMLADGGRVVTGVVENGVTRLATGRKSETGVALMPLAEIGAPRFGQFDRPQRWSF